MPKSAEVFSKWIDGNKIYRHTNHNPFDGTKRKKQNQHSNVMRKCTTPHKFIKRFDPFPHQHFNDEFRINMMSHLTVVVLVLLLVVGCVWNKGLVSIIGVVLVILVLWYTVIPSINSSINSRRPYFSTV